MSWPAGFDARLAPSGAAAPPLVSPYSNPACRPWTASEDALLGRLPDEELGERLNRTLAAVKVRRFELHIAKLNSRKRPWLPERDRLLGTMSNEEVARRTGRSRSTVRRRRRALGMGRSE